AYRPGNMVVLPRGDHHAWDERSVRRRARCAELSPQWSSPGYEPEYRGNPRCDLDCPDHEHRRDSAHGFGFISSLLRCLDIALPRLLLRSGSFANSQPQPEPNDELQALRAHHRDSV